MKSDALKNLSNWALDNSKRWFPTLFAERTYTPTENALLHHALGLGGEAGEILNVIKKWHAGTMTEPKMKQLLTDELPDVLTYIFDIAAVMEIDLDQALHDKAGVCEGRWGQKYTWETVPVGHYVPGSGDIIAKKPHARGYHVTFRRRIGEPFSFQEEWTAYRLSNEHVPVALISRGLIF